MAALVAAVAQEWSKRESERTWEGEVFGFVPYSFQPPTWPRIRNAYWNPDEPRLFTRRVWGVGWALNLHRALELLFGAYSTVVGTDADPQSQPPAAARTRPNSRARR